MDEQKKATLDLIERAVVVLQLADRGKQLVAVARDYIDDDDAMQARRVLKLIPQNYFSDYMYVQTLEDRAFGEVVARLIEVLGYNFWLFGRETVSS